MNGRKNFITTAVGTVLVAIGLVALIYFKREDIKQARAAVAKLHTDIESARKLIEGSATLEREVIVLREIAPVFEAILPTTEDVNNLIQDFYRYSNDAQVKPTSFKRILNRGRQAQTSDFDKVQYTLTLQGNTFEFLDFLNLIETHDRFMAVSSFTLTSAPRQTVIDLGQVLHKINLDVETYSYVPKGMVDAVRIEGYERKRDLLAGEIARRRKALTLSTFEYRGARGRRDPWVDPRVPIVTGDGTGLTVPEQMALVDELSEQITEAQAMWEKVQVTPNILDHMVLKNELDGYIIGVEIELRRIDKEEKITYSPAQKRLQAEVREPLAALQEKLEETVRDHGPSKEEMEQVRKAMLVHVDEGEYDLALLAFDAVKDGLDQVQGDPTRVALAEELRLLAEDAEILSDFEKVEMEFGGYSVIEGKPPVIIINGRPLTIGDVFENELEVRDIRPNEIDFNFRGVILTRAF